MKKLIVPAILMAVVVSACGTSGTPAASEPTVQATDAPTSTETPAPQPEAVVRSGDGNVPVTLVLENQTAETLKIGWMDFDGGEQPYGELAPSTAESFQTYSTHVWRIRDDAGNVISDVAVTEEQVQKYVIGADKQVTAQAYTPCKLPSVTADRGVALGFPPIEDRMDSTGTVRAAVLFVDFPDMPGTRSVDELFEMLAGATDLYKTMSYGRMDWQLEPYLTMLRMNHTTVELGLSDNDISAEEHRAYIQEAMDLADANVDFSGVQAVYVISDPDRSPTSYGPAFSGAPGFSVNADGNEILSGVNSGQDLSDWGFMWLNHEVGHTMGLVDLYAYEYDPNNYDSMGRFVGAFSLMDDISGRAPEFFAFERWQLGWLDDGQVVCQLGSDLTITLTTIETEGGVKAVMVPTGPTSAVVVESRRALGYDSELVKAGALVYVVDTSIYSGYGVIQVQPVIEGDPFRDQSPLAAGESVTVGNVTITVVEATEEGDTVQVTVAP